jgi:hypothetical protein
MAVVIRITFAATPVRAITASEKELGHLGLPRRTRPSGHDPGGHADDHIFQERDMHTKLATAIAVLALLGGCNNRRDRDTGALDHERSGTDTSIQSSTIKDTTVVKADTSIDVDTVKKTDNIEKKNK